MIALSLITPIDNLSVKDSSKTTKNVIGFSNDNVYTFADAKKKPEGSPDLRKDIQYNDFCVDFTLKVRKLLQLYPILSEKIHTINCRFLYNCCLSSHAYIYEIALVVEIIWWGMSALECLLGRL